MATAKETVKGSKLVYLYRVQKTASTDDATHIAFVTENERSKSKDADSTVTKDGSIRTPGGVEQEITGTSLLMQGDTFLNDLEDSMDSDDLIEIWEANLEEKKEDIYALTEDTDIVEGKDYYTRGGSAPDYTYTKVENPVKSSLGTYYEITGAKYAGKYFQGYLTEISRSSNSEDMVEVSLTFGINGKGADGNVTVTTEQADDAGYAFVDTPATGA